MVDADVQQQGPAWAGRIRCERAARGWSEMEAVRALRLQAPHALPADGTLIRDWKRWEAGDVEPAEVYRPLLAKTLGTVVGVLFPDPRQSLGGEGLADGTAMDTVEVVSRLRSRDAGASALDGLRVAVEQLCTGYSSMSSDHLRREGRAALLRLTALLDHRLAPAQRREVLALAGWVALTVGCVHHDMGDARASESTRQAALSLGREAGHAEIVAWAHEMRAWHALTSGDVRGVIAASEAGHAVAPTRGVSVQLAAQRARAWARVGDRRQVDVALDTGRNLLQSLPHPDDPGNHFVVDPAKYDFYAMDCYRILGEDCLAEMYAREVISRGTSADGTERSPMRVAEARVTLGVVAARAGDPDQAVACGELALSSTRKSLPSLRMCFQELATILCDRYPSNPEARAFVEHIRVLGTGSP